MITESRRLEAVMQKRVMRALKPLHAIHISADQGGIPDISYANGWVELKAKGAWPLRPPTPLRIPHFTGEQRIFLANRTKAGGVADLLLQVGAEWFLLHGRLAARFLGQVPRNDILFTQPIMRWATTPTDKQLLECFTALTN